MDEMTPRWAVELMIRFERLESRLATNDERHNAHADWTTRNIKDHEIRIRNIEKKLWGAVGAAGVIATVITIAGRMA
jgi:hypothetical protein